MGEGCGVLNVEAVSPLIATAFENKWAFKRFIPEERQRNKSYCEVSPQ